MSIKSARPNFVVRHLPPDMDLSDKIIAMIGPRKSGKSWAIRHLMYSLDSNSIPYSSVFSRTEGASGFFKKFTDDIYIFEKPNEDRLAEIVERGMRTKNLINNAKEFAKELFQEHADEDERDDMRDAIGVDDDDKIEQLLFNNIGKYFSTLPDSYKEKLIPLVYVDPRSLIIYDDCLYDASAFKGETMREIFMNGRHYKMTFIFAMQSPKKIPPDLRDNIDYIFIYGGGDLKKVWETYIGQKIDFKDFKKVTKKVCKNHKCLVIHLTSGKSIWDSMWTFKAEAPPSDFIMGCDISHELHQLFYNNNAKQNKISEMMNRDERDVVL